MITVYYGRVPAEIDGDAWKFCLEKIEAGRRERLERMQSRVQRLRSLAAGCLLHDALCRELGLLPKEKGQDGESYGCYGGMSVHGINETLSLFVSIYTVYP
jgi:hypothetical protein